MVGAADRREIGVGRRVDETSPIVGPVFWRDGADVGLQVGHIDPVVRRGAGRVGAQWGFDDPGDDAALERVEAGVGGQIQPLGRHHLFGRDEDLIGGAGHQIVEEGVGAEDQGVARLICAVDVQNGGVQLDRRHGQQGLAVLIGRADRLDALRGNIRRQAEGGGQEGQAHGRGPQAPVQQAFVQFKDLQRARLSCGAEMRVQGEMIQRNKAEDQLLHLARRHQGPDVGAAVADDGQVLKVRTRDGAHEGHGLSARGPTPDSDGHSVAQAGDKAIQIQPFIQHAVTLREAGKIGSCHDAMRPAGDGEGSPKERIVCVRRQCGRAPK